MRERLAPWLISSVALSIAALIAPAVGHGLTIFGLSLIVSIAFSIAWLLIFIVALRVHRRRGLWLLFGLPSAIVWPALSLWFFLGFALCAASGSRMCDL